MAEFAGDHIICCVTGAHGSTEHHIYTQKAHSEHVHAVWNKMPLCQELHNEAHGRGMVHMSRTYPEIKEWLEVQGWELCPVTNKWFHA